MTANQIAYQKNLESERANKENERLQRQRMLFDWAMANLQAQTTREKIASDQAINAAQLQSKERLDYYNRQQNWETSLHDREVRREQNAINLTEAETHKEQVNVNKAKVAFDFGGNLLNIASRLAGGFALFG